MTQSSNAPSRPLTDLHVVAAIVFKEGRVMAAKRLAGGPSRLMWEFPGGKVENGEHPEAALVREIQEELGMAIAIREELGSFVSELGKWRLRLHCFICDAISEPSRLEAHSEIRWCVLGELRGIEWAGPDIPAVDALCARYEAGCI